MANYDYTPRGSTVTRPDMRLDTPTLLALKDVVANTFASLRAELGEEVSVGQILKITDEAILSQPGVSKKVELEGIAPARLAQMAYGVARDESSTPES